MGISLFDNKLENVTLASTSLLGFMEDACIYMSRFNLRMNMIQCECYIFKYGHPCDWIGQRDGQVPLY